MCNPKKSGGLGIGNILCRNKALVSPGPRARKDGFPSLSIDQVASGSLHPRTPQSVIKKKKKKLWENFVFMNYDRNNLAEDLFFSCVRV